MLPLWGIDSRGGGGGRVVLDYLFFIFLFITFKLVINDSHLDLAVLNKQRK